MKRAAAVLRGFTIVLFLLSLLSPLAAVDALAQDQPGSLTIVLHDAAGNLLAGGRFKVTDADGAVVEVADETDGLDGYTLVNGLAAGDAAVVQTGGPDTHTFNPEAISFASVPAGGVGELRLTNALIVQKAQVEVVDTDGDGTPDAEDDTPTGDNDGDGIDNAQDPTPDGDPDTDGDGATDSVDNCVNDPNDQLDTDADGAGDACDDDDDNDTLTDAQESERGTDPVLPDTDADGAADAADNCATTANADQADNDGDGIGNACDDTPDGDQTEEPPVEPVDTDADGVTDDADNCADVANDDQLDTDGDGQGDACDDNDDNDSHPDAADNCPLVSNKNQLDRDADGIGNACDEEDNSETSFAAADFEIAAVTDASIDFSAPDPADYDHNNPADTGGDTSDEVETLNGGDFICGEYIHYFNRVTVDAGSGSITFLNGFAKTTTNGGLVGFGDIVNVFVDTTDTANSGLDGDEAAFLISEVDTGTEIQGTIEVTNLSPGETIVVRVVAQLVCAPNPGNTGGVVQARLQSSGGDQTVNLTAVGQVEFPNILISKTADAPSVNAGQPIGFTITVTNTGNGDATGVAFTDPLPGGPGIDWSESPDQGACAISGSPPNETLDCSGITLASNGGTLSVHVTSPTTAASCGTHDNTAILTAGGTGSAGAVITVTCPDVSIAKTADTSPINAGETASYTITVTNEGDVPATNVEVTETLPGGTWTLTPSQGTCSGTSGVVTCDLGTIAVSGSATITVSRTTTVADCGTLTNQASVTADTDIDAANNGPVSADIQVVCPDVSVQKSTTTPTVDSGGAVNYTITVTNNGPGTADVTVTDDLPDEVTWTINPAVTGCSIDGSGDLACTFDDMAPGSAAITLAGTVPADFCGTLSNTASITVPGDTNTGNNTSDTVVITVNCADVGVVKSPDGGTISAGELASFSILVTNDGPGVATDVTLSDTLPDAATWDVSFPAGVTCEGTPGADTVPATGSYTCDLGDLNDGESVSITVSRTTTSTDCTTLTNTATVAAANEDPAADSEGEDADQSDTGTITVQCPGVSITKTGNGTITAGDTASFTIAVSNAGPGTATGVVLTDDLPDGIVWDTVNVAPTGTLPAAPACSLDGSNNLTCPSVDLAGGQGFTVTVSGPTDNTDCGTILNTAQVQVGNDTNPNPIDSNQATVVVECPDVTVTKVADDGIVSAGDPIGFTIAVTNLGPGTVTGVVLSDELPDNAGLSWTIDAVTPTGGLGAAPACDFDGEGDLLCDAVNLAPGQGFEVAISSPTTAATCGQVSNTATVTATNENPAGTAPNTAIDTVQVQCPDVTVEKSTTTPTINSGDPANFTILVTNIGDGTATNVTVTDPLPDGVDWNTATPGCAITPDPATSGQTLNCTFASLAPGADVEITVTVSGIVPETFCGPLTNLLVTVDAANEADADSANNTAGPVTITVNCPELTIEKDPDAGETGAVITAGDTATFTITVDNIGVGTATNVVVTDNLPDGINWDTPTAGCAVAPPATTADQVLTCNLGDVEPGDPPVVITVSGVTDPTDCTTLTNSASVDVDNGDEVSDDGAIDVNCPDVTVEKEPDAPDDPNSVVNAGDPISFTITVANVGAGEARGVQFNDSLPAGSEWAETADLSNVCAITGAVGSEVLECGPTTLAPTGETGDSFTVTVTGTTDAADCGTVTNTVTISADNELNTANNTDTGTVSVQCSAVTITKSGNGPITAGETATFTIAVTNNGPGTATGVVLTDDLPDGIVWDTIVEAGIGGGPAPDCSFVGGDLSCTAVTLDAGEGFTVTVSGPTDNTDCGTILNTAQVQVGNDASPDSIDSNEASIVVNCPDVEVFKEADEGIVSAGTAIGFTITVSNNGPGTATGVVLTDDLPDNLGLDWTIDVNVTDLDADAEADCAIAAGVLTCDPTSLDQGESFTIHITSPTTADTCGTVSNTAVVSATNENPAQTAPNQFTDSVTVQCPDVDVTKVAVDDQISAGEDAVFRIRVENSAVAGTGTATGVVLTDTLPAGPAWNPATLTVTSVNGGPTPACSLAGDVITCPAVDLAPGEGFEVTVTGETDAEDCTVLNNTAQVQVGNDASTDPIDSNSAQIEVLCSALDVDKTPDGQTINAGETATYQITVDNTGEGTAFGVELTDTLPTGTWDVTVPAGVTCESGANTGLTGTFAATGSFTCDLGDIDPTDPVISITVSRETTAADCITLNNEAEATSTNGGFAEDTGDITVLCPDVTVEKTTEDSPANSGDEVSYVITVRNSDAAGTGTATDVELDDTLPGTADGVVWAVTAIDPALAATCDPIVNGVLHCDIPTLAAGASVQFTITATIPDAFCGELVNQAFVDAGNEANTGPASQNNQSESITIEVQCPDIVVTKEPDAPADPFSVINATDQAVYTIRVTNNGPGLAQNVTLTDTLPDAETWTLNIPAGVTCDGTLGPATIPVDGSFSCDLGDLADGAFVELSVNRATAPGECDTLTNAVTADAANDDEVSDQGTIIVQCPDVEVEKRTDTPTVNAGDAVDFTIAVSNSAAAGTGTAYDVELTDDLPDGVTWSVGAVTPTGGLIDAPSCVIDGNGDLDCAPVDLAPGEGFTVTVTGTVDAGDCPSISNQASISVANDDTTDPILSNEVVITVNCPAVTVVKTTPDGSVSAGENAVYQIVVSNAGPGTAYDLVLTDELPETLTWTVDSVVLSPDGTEPTCTLDGDQDLTCTAVDLLPGQSLTISLSAPTVPADCGDISNQAFAQVGNDATENPVASGIVPISINCSEVEVDKTADEETVDAGDDIGFTITVTNTGEGTAFGVTLTDTLPTNAGLSWTIDAVTPTGGLVTAPTCDFDAQDPGIIVCTPVDLKTGQGFAVHLSSPTTPETCGTVLNQVQVTLSTEETIGASADVVVECPSVLVTKTTPDDTVSAGEDAVFDITVVNNGDGLAKAVTLTDTLPAGPAWDFEIVDVNPDDLDPGCSIAGNNFECGPVDLDTGQFFTIRITGETDAADCGPLANTATVTLDNEPTTDTAPNQAGATVTVNCPDLEVTKVPLDDEISAGDPVSFTITVTNQGEGDAFDVQLTDNLPAGIDWDIDSSTEPSCAITGEIDSEILACGPVTLGPDASFSVTVTGVTDAEDCATLSNTATVTLSNEPAEDGFPNEAIGRVIIDCPDVDVTKTAGDDEISAGDTASFTITVQNNGDGVATGVVLTDDLPAGIAWTVDSVTPINNGPTPTCSTQTGDLVCDATTLDPGEGFEVRLSGLTDAADCGTLSNTALVQVGNDGSTEPIAGGPATIDVLCPDVRILKEALDTEVNAGESVGFQITVTNDGPGEAKGVEFFDTLPANVDWAETNDPSGVCDVTGAVGAEVLHCGPVDLGDGESFTVTVSGTVGPEDCGDLDNTVTVSADNEPQGVLQNNTSTAEIDVLCPDVEVTKTTPDDTVSAGEDAVFVIIVANTGEGVATNVNLTDNLPAGPAWSFVVTATTPDQLDPGCSLAGNAFECGPVALGTGEGFVVTITGVTDQNDCRDLVNTATVTVDNEATGTLDDNQSGATVTVECPDLVIEKSAGDGTISAGETASYTIIVTNNGPGQAFGVTLDDTLPTGIVWTENTDLDECSITGLELSCAIGTLDAGEDFSVTVEGETDAADCSTLQNQATADATNDDEVTSELIEIVVDCPELTVVKEAVDGEISAGEDAVFTITVTNNGDGTAFDVALTDELPAGVDWAITASTEASCAISGAVGSEVLACGPVDLTSGAGFSVTVAGATDAADCGTITNTATVNAGNLPEQQTELVQAAQIDSNTAEIDVTCPALTVVKEAVDDTISSGEDAAFTITVNSEGVGVAFDVTLTDELPDGIPWTTETVGCSITDTGTDGDLIDQVLTCDFGDLDPEESASVLVTGETDPSDCGQLVNTATADPANDDPVTSDPATIDVLCQELTIEKLAGDGTISAGETASYTITVGNTGEGDAFNVTIEDQLPEGVEWVEALDLDECEIVEGVLTCDVGTVSPEETFSVTVEGVTDAADCGTLENQATSDASNDDEATSELVVITVNCPDLTVVKEAEEAEINAGEDAVFVITVTNNGDGTAFDVELTDNLPAGIDWAITASTEESCEITGAVESEVLSCGPVDLAGEGGTFSVTVAGATDAADCGTIENSVDVSADNELGLLQAQADDSATMEVSCPDVTVEKTGNGPIAAGQQAVFTITLRNIGDGDALDVTLTDNLPDDLAWTLDPAVDDCAITDGILDCAFAVVPAGATITITVKAQTSVEDCRDLVNIVTVGAGNEPEDAIGNNEDVAVIAVQCGGVTITKVVCVVAKARDVAFLVTDPDGTTSGDGYHDAKKCKPAKDVEFTIDGDGIGAPVTVKTGADGTVSLQLPPGDYTITEFSTGASYGFTVHADGTTLVKVFNFKVKPAKPTPTPTPKPAPPTKLPDTGAGPAGDLGGQPWLILFITLVVSGGAAYALRRRTT